MQLSLSESEGLSGVGKLLLSVLPPCLHVSHTPKAYHLSRTSLRGTQADSPVRWGSRSFSILAPLPLWFRGAHSSTRFPVSRTWPARGQNETTALYLGLSENPGPKYQSDHVWLARVLALQLEDGGSGVECGPWFPVGLDSARATTRPCSKSQS